MPTGRRSPARGVSLQLPSVQLLRPDPDPRDLEPAERVAELWRLLCEAVQSAASPRVMLSGGLDSRLVAAAAAEVHDAPRFASFGDPDCCDLPIAVLVASRLGGHHDVAELDADSARVCELRVWHATGGWGGPTASPGAPCDDAFAGEVVLSGASGDVVWGRAREVQRGPARWWRRLGLPEPSAPEVPPPPRWIDPSALPSWRNLHTRQRLRTWMGALPRLEVSPVRPVPWEPAVLGFCLALPEQERVGRALVRRVLATVRPDLSAEALPPVRGPVHDFARALRGEGWRQELQRWLDRPEAWRHVRRRPVLRWLRMTLSGRRDRSGLIARVRAATRW
jgi:hypothetical protein